MFGRMMNNYYYGKSGKGDFRKEDLPKNRWQLFWEMLRVRFSALCRLNLMTIAAWLPLIILIGYLAGQLFNASVVVDQYEYYLQSGELGDLTQEQADALAEVDTSQMLGEMLIYCINTFCMWAIPCILVTGPVKAGMAYVTRNWARDEHAFLWSDFKDAVKANWKQALGISAITSVLPMILWISYQFYGGMAAQSVLYMIPQMLVFMVGLVWALGCTFMYPIMVTYNVKFPTLVKNGIMLAIARLPQTVGVRLAVLILPAIALFAFMMTGSAIALMVLAGYYILFGFAFTRFVFASFTNGVFDRFINSRIEGVEVNRGLASDDDEEDEDEAESTEDEQPGAEQSEAEKPEEEKTENPAT